MNTSQNDLAAKIAELIAADSRGGGDDLSAVLAAIERIESRLEKLESAPEPPKVPRHPSAEHFDIVEAIADRIFKNPNSEKACAFEPNGKPCDHCSMCNSRGF